MNFTDCKNWNYCFMKTVILGLAIGLSLFGCVEKYDIGGDKKQSLISQTPMSMGTSFSNLLQRTGAQVSVVLPLRYPTEWPKEKLRKELVKDAYKYGGNVMYVERDGKIILNAPNADQESYWTTNFLQQPNFNSFFHWESDIRSEFKLDGEITANYVLLARYYEENGADEDYYVLLVKNDKIVGYILPYPITAGRIEYEKSHLGFFVY